MENATLTATPVPIEEQVLEKFRLFSPHIVILFIFIIVAVVSFLRYHQEHSQVRKERRILNAEAARGPKKTRLSTYMPSKIIKFNQNKSYLDKIKNSSILPWDPKHDLKNEWPAINGQNIDGSKKVPGLDIISESEDASEGDEVYENFTTVDVFPSPTEVEKMPNYAEDNMFINPSGDLFPNPTSNLFPDQSGDIFAKPTGDIFPNTVAFQKNPSTPRLLPDVKQAGKYKTPTSVDKFPPRLAVEKFENPGPMEKYKMVDL